MKNYSIHVTKISGLGISGFQVEAESAEDALNKFFETYPKSEYYEVQAIRIETEMATWKASDE